MSNKKRYKVLGIMTGTSMDGIDMSYIKTDGIDYVKVINEKSYQYSILTQKKLKNIIITKIYKKKYLEKKFKIYDDLINKIIIKYVEKFLKEFRLNIKNLNLISLSGQTIFHNPNKKISIQLGSPIQINKYFKIPVISNFREKDILNGGTGAPIGAYYHKYLLNKINKKSIIINLGGVSNYTQIMNGKLLSSDIGPANSLSDDLTYYFYKKKYDKFGMIASSGVANIKLIKKFKNDIFFKNKMPQSIDRNYFKKYYHFLKKIKKNNAINTSIHFVMYSIINIVKKNNYFNGEIILTGGGRKNKFLLKLLKENLPNLNINTIDIYGFNGDLIESQMFGYIGVRSIKKLIISNPNTTKVKKAMTGGKIYKLFEN